MSPAHLTLLLLVPAFVAGMYWQFHRHHRHFLARWSHYHSLRAPRLVTGPIGGGQAGLGLGGSLPAPRLIAHFTAPVRTELRDRLWRVQWSTAQGQVSEAYVHADTLADAADTFQRQTGIDQFKVTEALAQPHLS